jgi:hypothetical protein
MSTTTLGWLMNQRSFGNTFLWIHGINDGLYRVLSQRQGDSLRCNTYQNITDLQTECFLESFLSNYEIVCLDGDIPNVNYLIGPVHQSNRFVIVCSSYQRLTFSFAFDRHHSICRYFYSSWLYDEYVQMNNLHLFRYLNNGEDLTINQIQQRFYYGGGCLHLFALSEEAAHQIFAIEWGRCSKKSDLARERFGCSIDPVVNSLMSLYNGYSRPVSDYITLQLSKLADMEIIRAVKTSEHPQYQVWAAEFEVKTRLRICITHPSGHGFRIYGENGKMKELVAQKIIDYSTSSELITPPTNQCIYIPKKSVNPCFDLFYHEIIGRVSHVYFIHVTGAVVTQNFDYSECGTVLQMFFPTRNGVQTGLQRGMAMTSRNRYYQKGIHVHFYMLLPHDRFVTDHTVGVELNQDLIKNYDPLFAGTKLRYYEER